MLAIEYDNSVAPHPKIDRLPRASAIQRLEEFHYINLFQIIRSLVSLSRI